MTDYLFARFYERLPGMGFRQRGEDFVCESATGREAENIIGFGKVVIPAYTNNIRGSLSRIQDRDVCQVWTIAPYGDYDHRPLHVAMFLVETRQYKEGKFEISGPDFIAELTEYATIAPVGQLAEVVVGALSMGTRTVNHPFPQDDTYEIMKAAYPARSGITQDVTDAGKGGILFLDPINIQETDEFYYEFSLPNDATEIFSTTVTATNSTRTYVQIADVLPYALPGGAKVTFRSRRLRVTDGSALVAGALLFYTPEPQPGLGNPKPQGNLLIDRIEEGEGDAPDYVYTLDPIVDYIADGTSLTQFQYTKPTTADVAMLLSTSTFNQWQVERSIYATTGSAYAPQDESVFDVLLAITDITGYRFRRTFPVYSPVPQPLVSGPVRQIQYYPPGRPPIAAEVTLLSTESRIATDYGEIFNLETDDNSSIVTHLFPYGGGGGSGRFNISEADFGILANDYPTIGHGTVNHQHYVYNKSLSGKRPVSKSETFSHISPLDNTSFASRREAATQLLKAACDWLLERATTDTTFVAECFTIGEPRPGDKLRLQYIGIEPGGDVDLTLIITEVEHSISPDRGGYRVTRLTLSQLGHFRVGGEQAQAKEILDLRRALRRANFGSRGDARISADTMEFGQDANVTAMTGNVVVKSTTGDVTIRAELGDVNLEGNNIDVLGRIVATGDILSESGFVLPDGNNPHDWALGAFTLRGIPRLKARWRERTS